MAHISGATRVAETSTSTGTGNITVAGAHETGDRTLASVMTTNGDTMDVHIKHSTLGEWEFVRVTRVSATEFSRATPFASSNAGSAVAFSAGGLIVFTGRGERELAPDNENTVPLPLATADPPEAPASGLDVFAASVAGGGMLSQIRNGDRWQALQQALYSSRISFVAALANSTTLSTFGFATSTQGTATARNPASTSLFTSSRRVGYVSAATVGSSAGLRTNTLQFWRGNAAGLGGFLFAVRFGSSDAATVANSRMFAGMYGSAANIGNVEPNSLLNIIGVGANAGASSLSIMHNDGSGNATSVALGANFPAQTLSVDMYELVLFAAPNASGVGYRVERLNTGHIATGTINTDLPANTQFLAPQIWRNNGSTALAVGIDMCVLHAETNF